MLPEQEENDIFNHCPLLPQSPMAVAPAIEEETTWENPWTPPALLMRLRSPNNSFYLDSSITNNPQQSNYIGGAEVTTPGVLRPRSAKKSKKNYSTILGEHGFTRKELAKIKKHFRDDTRHETLLKFLCDNYDTFIRFNFNNAQLAMIAKNRNAFNILFILIAKHSELTGSMEFNAEELTRIANRGGAVKTLQYLLANYRTLVNFGFSHQDIATIAMYDGAYPTLRALCDNYPALKTLNVKNADLVSIAAKPNCSMIFRYLATNHHILKKAGADKIISEMGNIRNQKNSVILNKLRELVTSLNGHPENGPTYQQPDSDNPETNRRSLSNEPRHTASMCSFFGTRIGNHSMEEKKTPPSPRASSACSSHYFFPPVASPILWEREDSSLITLDDEVSYLGEIEGIFLEEALGPLNH